MRVGCQGKPWAPAQAAPATAAADAPCPHACCAVDSCDDGWRDGCLGKERGIEFWLAGEEWHRLSLDYFNPAGSSGSLVLSWAGPGIPTQRVPSANLRTPALTGQDICVGWVGLHSQST